MAQGVTWYKGRLKDRVAGDDFALDAKNNGKKVDPLDRKNRFLVQWGDCSAIPAKKEKAHNHDKKSGLEVRCPHGWFGLVVSSLFCLHLCVPVGSVQKTQNNALQDLTNFPSNVKMMFVVAGGNVLSLPGPADSAVRSANKLPRLQIVNYIKADSNMEQLAIVVSSNVWNAESSYLIMDVLEMIGVLPKVDCSTLQHASKGLKKVDVGVIRRSQIVDAAGVAVTEWKNKNPFI
jgi:hypothetical protein